MYDWVLQEYQYMMNIIDISLIYLIPSRNRLGGGGFCMKQEKPGIEHSDSPRNTPMHTLPQGICVQFKIKKLICLSAYWFVSRDKRKVPEWKSYGSGIPLLLTTEGKGIIHHEQNVCHTLFISI